ncbi:MAG: 2-C-methyl-D-erythritol 4-phosphate cytidylyltransferase [Alphaproteobacteria bacterium]|nr:2-C-methyl-D-erythritol 4-phosphate cytidylyltransferase [Alphaproteobacteria bacterium]
MIVAAGSGQRFSSDTLKQYAPLGGRPVISYSIEKFAKYGPVALVVNPAHAPYFPQLANGVTLVDGGASRQESVANGLLALGKYTPRNVMIHDAARPLVSDEAIARIQATIEGGTKAATLAVPVADTLMRGHNVVDRTGVMAVQTPQAFAFDVIVNAHVKAQGRSYTDDSSLVFAEEGIESTFVEGESDNFKITTQSDLKRAEKIMSSILTETRVGMGYDVHPFGDAPESGAIKLFGVDIPSDRKLVGHSDADAGLHAIADAILGTIGAGDIGVHFPPSNPALKGMDSSAIVKKAMELLANKNGTLTNIDITLLAEAPRIGPHREAITKRLSDMLSLPADAIGLKATTTEKLGYIGRGEGLAVQAVATVRLRK